ncbi:Rmp1p [Lachancea thermotolerans CBS 6340]|uniref:KLTH0G11506p n=1 Tax=Lachancea thermotolerans (strain ATCC 56472 / CBS 6340 / NRRL Y-8284) TaxID=559295 RepID=C5DMT6_LACTC|nr:KLTH0G11506p [Lachancea thermotolerans CBS 6340]CAR25097.1 KLTH0G11506p [Lachancea thermotolerans CBS 6340]
MKPDGVAVVDKLHQEVRYVLLINHRNKNQHRMAVWWKHFNELKRSSAQVLELLQHQKLNAVQLRKLYSLLNKFQKKQLSRMYYSFNGVVGLGQFVTLGVVLIGLLARVNALYRQIYADYEREFKNLALIRFEQIFAAESPVEKQLQSLVNEELGEVVDESMVPLPKTEINSNAALISTQKMKAKKKVKKKKKSAIDDIFG